MWKRIIEHRLAKKYGREKSWKSQSPYNIAFKCYIPIQLYLSQLTDNANSPYLYSLISSSVVLFHKILFCKKIYTYQVSKYLKLIQRFQLEDLMLLSNALGSLKQVSTQEIVQQLLIKLDLRKMISLWIRSTTILAKDQL